MDAHSAMIFSLAQGSKGQPRHCSYDGSTSQTMTAYPQRVHGLDKPVLAENREDGIMMVSISFMYKPCHMRKYVLIRHGASSLPTVEILQIGL